VQRDTISLSGRQRTVGLSGGNAVHATAGNAGPAAGRAARQLYVDPALPDWLPDATLMDLRLGRQRFDIRFWRHGKNTLFKVLAGKRASVEWRSVALSASVVGDDKGAGVTGQPARIPAYRRFRSPSSPRYVRKIGVRHSVSRVNPSVTFTAYVCPSG
jgi:hypothetical protein